MSTMTKIFSSIALSAVATGAYANQCETVRFADVGWTDITATTAVTSELLKGLGYKTKTDLLSVPVTYSSMANGDIDVFLGNWMPTMEAISPSTVKLAQWKPFAQTLKVRNTH